MNMMMPELIAIVILAATSLIFFFRYIHLKNSIDAEFNAYEDRLEAEKLKSRQLESQYQNQIQSLKTATTNETAVTSNNNNDALLAEIELLRKEKAEEFKLRLEAEKQVELALQKTSNVDQKIEDWKKLQESNLKDALNTITKVGNDLYEKLISNHKYETEETRHLLVSAVEDSIGRLNLSAPETLHDDHFVSDHNETNFAEEPATTNTVIDTPPQPISPNFKNNKNIRFDHDEHHYTIEEVLQSAGFEPGVNYYPHHYIPLEVRKSVPCESFIILDENNCLIVDTKSLRFFKELYEEKNAKNPDAMSNFKHKIDRYLSYLSNPKYQINIINYFSSHNIVKKDIDPTLIMLVPTHEEVDEFLSLGEGYKNFLEDYRIQLHSLDSISDLIFDNLL